MLSRKKGQFTVANLAGVVVLLFLFAVTSDLWLKVLSDAAASSGPLLSAVLYTIPAIIFLSIFGAPFVLAQIRFEEEQARKRQSRGVRR